MNNKGFAITTILFGITLLFCLLMISMLGILSTYRNNLELLIENDKGARNTLTMKKKDINDISEIKDRGLYCINGDCKYYTTSGTISES